jgi:hypothetical protein
MNYIKPMNYKEFAELISSLGPKEEFYFGCNGGVNWPDKIPDVEEVTSWYYVQYFFLEDRDSRFIIIDYCGGEEAYVIPISNSDNKTEHLMSIECYVKDYFENHNPIIGGLDEMVFVEMEKTI